MAEAFEGNQARDPPAAHGIAHGDHVNAESLATVSLSTAYIENNNLPQGTVVSGSSASKDFKLKILSTLEKVAGQVESRLLANRAAG